MKYIILEYIDNTYYDARDNFDAVLGYEKVFVQLQWVWDECGLVNAAKL